MIQTGEVPGGIQGHSSLGHCLSICFIFPPAFRRMGIGSEILTRFENEGRKRGCSAGFVYTICFQAPDFYKKHGWEEFGRIDRKAEGTSRIFMKKSLYIFNAIAKKEQCEFTALQVLHLR
ncbi:GNAT family N-acetyltransferase [Pantoea allii]|uniref:GNAT family N-acetyltransferase n=1 Tax=Pantoea allii TaxID=574096 RepID=UPI003211A5E9